MEFNWSLKSKFLSLTLLLVTITSLTTVVVVSFQLTDQLTNQKYNELHQSLSFISSSLNKDIKQLTEDAHIIANSRLIKSVVANNNNIDSFLSLIEQEEWKESLTVLFNQILAANSHYFKVRYVRYQKGTNLPSAKELLVIRRQNNSVIQLPDDQLQEKIHRGYIQNALSLKPNQTLLSELSLNREFGVISEPKTATLRAVAPIFHKQKLHGFIIISMDVTQMFHQLTQIITPPKQFYALRSDGYYFHHPDNEQTFSFEFKDKAQYTLQQDFTDSEALITVPKQINRETVYKTDKQKMAIVTEQVFFDSLNPHRYMLLALVQPYQEIDEITQNINISLLTTGFIIALIAGATAFLMMRTLAQPVKQLLNSMKQFGDIQQVGALPVQRHDELGVLARHFHKMSSGIKRQTEQLNQEIKVRRLTESRLKKQEVELKRSNSELEKFAYVASHDLQEPLRKVQAFGDRLAERMADKLDDKSFDYLSRMQQAASRMSQLISDLLAFSRVATRGRPFTQQSIDNILDGVLSDLEVAIEQSNTLIKREPLPELSVDEGQFRQLLQNLVGNAIKFRQQDKQHIVNIWSKLSQDNSKVCIYVKDNGIGFDPKYADRIFEVFQRLHARSQYEGTGIGLAICRKIVERHGGTIDVISQPGEGAEFIIELPIQWNREDL
ncbi:sensor histidine kinase [Pleionea mediterranea]|uniref:histidine kinase n=1 Tax=Pleionea mediterranea TaxID=523701 RepID=A0A316G035_9GAMM|nr:ATP-binding protein [Pleionea mediterranea]PWK53745.1 phospho-acceptor domain-containing protein [Pleionea mediterranea]